ncbi:MAG TPA: cyclic nucleotide-binding domain-containing protein [Nitrospirota bacterium]|nr:cyclic nucleotide-binding domain-containing protein [Nitrospirota bacterium]
MSNKSELRLQTLFSELNDAELDVIAGKIVSRDYAKGATIFREGDPTKGLYLIRKGKVEISKMTSDGWRQTLAVLPQNHFFGELSVVEGRQIHSADATAIDDTFCFEYSKDDLLKLETSDPALMYKIMRAIARTASRNVHKMNEKLLKALISY